MSKYIKLEDAIEAYNQAATNLVESEMEEFDLGDFTECQFNTTQIKLIARMIASLPTIEVSEDCISREYLERQLQLIEDITAMAHIDLGEDPYDETEEIAMPINTVRKIFRNAPSVVPQVPSEDCISRADLFEKMQSLCHETDKGCCGDCHKVCDIVDCLDFIMDAPSVVPTVRKNRTVEQSSMVGEWIINEPIESGFGTIFECPYCKYEIEFEPTNYCPNCGAKMKV